MKTVLLSLSIMAVVVISSLSVAAQNTATTTGVPTDEKEYFFFHQRDLISADAQTVDFYLHKLIESPGDFLDREAQFNLLINYLDELKRGSQVLDSCENYFYRMTQIIRLSGSLVRKNDSQRDVCDKLISVYEKEEKRLNAIIKKQEQTIVLQEALIDTQKK